MIPIIVAVVMILIAICCLYALRRVSQPDPGRRARSRIEPSELLERALPVAGQLPMLPVEPLGPAGVTVRLPHAHGTWGMPAEKLLDQLARDYLEVNR